MVVDSVARGRRIEGRLLECHASKVIQQLVDTNFREALIFHVRLGDTLDISIAIEIDLSTEFRVLLEVLQEQLLVTPAQLATVR